MRNKMNKNLLVLLTITGASIALVGCSNNLETYTDDEHGLEFQYPSSWEKDTNVSGNLFTVNDSDEYQSTFTFGHMDFFDNNFEFSTQNIKEVLLTYIYNVEDKTAISFKEPTVVDGETVDEVILESNDEKSKLEFTQVPKEYKVDGKTVHEFALKSEDGEDILYSHFAVFKMEDGTTKSFSLESFNKDKYGETFTNLVKSVTFLDSDITDKESSK